MEPLPVGLVFPGQGTQREGMGLPWRDSESWALVAEVSEHAGQDIEELLLRTSADTLRRTDLAQLCVYTVAMMAHGEALRRGALEGAVACAGHSLGEYAALTAAGALTLPDAVTLVAARGRAMREAAELREGTMGVLVGAPLEEVEGLVRTVRADGLLVWVANINAPGQVVVSGTVDGIERVFADAPGIGAKLIRMQVGGAFHSPLMEPAAERLAAALRGVSFAPRHTPVVANVDAEPYSGDCDWPGVAVRQLVSPVRWEQSVRTLTDRLGCRRLVELGPGRTMAGLIRRISPDTEVVSVDDPGVLN
ncbi:ACP S-malonyltransferase [Streptomyces sp. M2CJ-2]|uniref:ACP S-malonyltransferase n=1 Tax=Streptomyces sp. M2CJ-2 TaxID=2803948 RepID=UPI001927D019|nr:ACP S-malonyltransferase [Streptomyces sp. M2CJ-2]MBL3669484.1 ACP S-malonyltransferase [Streptomyces sp. M2CJ-2]